MLFMVESTNVPYLTRDSMSLYLTEVELRDTGLRVFKNFGLLAITDSFLLHVLLRIGPDTSDRDYTFFLRTYTADFKVVDSYDIAVWSIRNDRFCWGSVDREFLVERSCDGQETERATIDSNGRFVTH